jgi:hypothetical protein
VTGYGRDGKPRPNGLLHALEINAVALLREPGTSPRAMKIRLSARMWLLNHGWTVDEINAARDAA